MSVYLTVAGLIPQSPQLQAQVTLGSLGSLVTSRDSARSCVRVDQRFSAVTAVEVPVFFCLRSNSSHVTEVGGP